MQTPFQPHQFPEIPAAGASERPAPDGAGAGQRAGLMKAMSPGVVDFLFRQLRVTDTQETVSRFVKVPEVRRSGPAALRIKAGADDWDLSD